MKYNNTNIDYDEKWQQLTMMKMMKFKFHPWWITGFTQADGAFVVSFDYRDSGIIPYRPRPTFVLSQSIREVNIMKELHTQLGVDNLRFHRDSVDIVVRSMNELTNIILPHFDKYPVVNLFPI